MMGVAFAILSLLFGFWMFWRLSSWENERKHQHPQLTELDRPNARWSEDDKSTGPYR